MAVIVCKRRGDNYEMKDILELNYFKITNNPTTDREGKKVSWLHTDKVVPYISDDTRNFHRGGQMEPL